MNMRRWQLAGVFFGLTVFIRVYSFFVGLSLTGAKDSFDSEDIGGGLLGLLVGLVVSIPTHVAGQLILGDECELLSLDDDDTRDLSISERLSYWRWLALLANFGGKFWLGDPGSKR